MRYLKIFAFLLLVTSCFTNSEQQNNIKFYPKINGITFDGPATSPITAAMFNELKNTGTTWISSAPEALTYRNTLDVKSFYKEGQWYGETIHGSLTVITIAKAKDYKVMMKPHIGFSYDISNWENNGSIDFAKKDSIINATIKNTKELKGIKDVKEFQKKVRNHKSLKKHYDEIDDYYKSQKKYIASQKNLTKGTWRGDFDVVDSKDWGKWEAAYEKYILDSAKRADSLKVDLFCIGTELSVSSVKREDFWRQLIKKVKKIYQGPLTFSANWDSYQKIKFWDELDYIGVSAYFPISEKESPSMDEILEGWKTHASNLEKISKKYVKPILFTEYGYKSVDYAAKEPWKEYVNYEANEILQSNLYKGLYQTFWKKEWFAGGFIWKWYYQGNGGKKSFSPQKKVAEKSMTEWYSNFKR